MAITASLPAGFTIVISTMAPTAAARSSGSRSSPPGTALILEMLKSDAISMSYASAKIAEIATSEAGMV